MCDYCNDYYIMNDQSDISVCGKMVKTSDLRHMIGFDDVTVEVNGRLVHNSFLQMYIYKTRDDDKASLMIETIDGIRYIDIEYCPFCGRKLNKEE